MSEATPRTDDAYLQRIKEARSKPAVQKIALAALRSSIPNMTIVVLEGKDDKPVYAQWFQRIRNDFRYEPFVCNGKRQLLSLRTSLENDLGNLRDKVYFFVDRDFDDLCDQKPGPDIFMTDRYSIENYLTNEDMLEHLLVNYFHCDGDVNVRESIKSLFKKIMLDFFDLMKETNFILFISKILKIEVSGNIDKISKIVAVEIDSVSLSQNYAEGKLKLMIVPDEIDLGACQSKFSKLSPDMRHRGKYIAAFFFKWLQLLGEERIHRKTTLFGQLYNVNSVKTNDISMALLASISPIPDGLPDFVRNM